MPNTASGTAHQRWRFDGRSDACGAGSLGTIGNCVLSSVILKELLTVRAGWTLGVAVALVVAIGLVKPVRANGGFAQRAWEMFPGLRPWLRPRIEIPVPVEHLPVELYTRPPLWRRGLALLLGIVLSIVVGTLIAIAVGAGAVWFVSSLIGRLK